MACFSNQGKQAFVGGCQARRAEGNERHGEPGRRKMSRTTAMRVSSDELPVHILVWGTGKIVTPDSCHGRSRNTSRHIPDVEPVLQ